MVTSRVRAVNTLPRVRWSPAHRCGGEDSPRGGVGSSRRPDELERRLRERLDAVGPAPRAELLHVLMLPDTERADGIGE